MKTRSQEYSKLVFEQVMPMKKEIDEAAEGSKEEKQLKKEAKAYGTLCHNFPLMVLKSGLSQAIAFVWVKANGTQDKPYKTFLKHLAKLVGFSPDNDPMQFQQHINRLDLMEYQRQTRKILAASIWYKRFAESILNVKPGEDNDA